MMFLSTQTTLEQIPIEQVVQVGEDVNKTDSVVRITLPTGIVVNVKAKDTAYQ